MANIVELSSTVHRTYKILPDCACQFAATQQVMLIKYPEIAPIAASSPVFLTRDPNNGNLAFSALMSFDAQQNLSVSNNEWLTTYQPISMRTYPLFLMRSAADKSKLTIGINEENPHISEDAGAALFDENGSATQMLISMQKMLEADLKNEVDTQNFVKVLEAHNLLRKVDLVVSTSDNTNFNITGIYTIDEDALKTLDKESILALNQQGYLQQIHALLFSIYQINGLIRKHNDVNNEKIVRVKLESHKDQHQR